MGVNVGREEGQASPGRRAPARGGRRSTSGGGCRSTFALPCDARTRYPVVAGVRPSPRRAPMCGRSLCTSGATDVASQLLPLLGVWRSWPASCPSRAHTRQHGQFRAPPLERPPPAWWRGGLTCAGLPAGAAAQGAVRQAGFPGTAAADAAPPRRPRPRQHVTAQLCPADVMDHGPPARAWHTRQLEDGARPAERSRRTEIEVGP